MHDLLPHATPVLADSMILMSIAKPILLVALFVPYMRFVAQFESDARRFTLPVEELATTEAVRFTMAAEVNREDFGLTFNDAVEAVGILVGRAITITIDAAIRRAPEPVGTPGATALG